MQGNCNETSVKSERYWDELAGMYQSETRISTRDFHYGPLLAGDKELRLLPDIAPDARCLEVGCGAGQNSIYLARQGFQCVAIDISEKQLSYGRDLARQAGVNVTFQRVAMEDLPMKRMGSFDIIHSSYALPFADDPAQVVSACSAMLKPGGTFLLTMGHPLHAGEWLELEAGETGIFLRDYFNPPPDVRVTTDGQHSVAARTYSISTMTGWLHESGFTIERILEPQPLPIDSMSEEEIIQRVPYHSKDWCAMFSELARIPFLIIFQCTISGHVSP